MPEVSDDTAFPHRGAAAIEGNERIGLVSDPDGTPGNASTTIADVLSATAREGGVPLRVGAGWEKFFAASANARDTPVNIVVFGDSVGVGGTEGNLGSALPWPWWLEGLLNGYIQKGAPGGWVPASPTAIGPHADEGTGDPSSQDFSNKAVLIDGTDYFQHTFADIDRVMMVYRRSPGSSQLRIRDGGPAGTILATVNTSGTSAYSQMWVSDPLTPGEHTIYIDDGGGSGTQILAGVYGFNGNYDSGFRVWPACKSGAFSTTSTGSNGYAAELVAQVDPDLVIYATGFNDNAVDHDYDTDMRAQIDHWLPLAPNASHVLVIPYILPTQGDRWDETKVAQARQIAEDYGMGVIDQSAATGLGTPDMLFDSTHPNAAGSRRIAYHALTHASGDPIGSVLALADLGWIGSEDALSTHLPVTAVSSIGVKGDPDDPFSQAYLISKEIAQALYAVQVPMLVWDSSGTVFPTKVLALGTDAISPNVVLRPPAAVAGTDAMILSQRTVAPIYGSGADGPLVMAGGTTTLTRDMQYSSISGTGTIVTANWRVMCNGPLSGSVAFTSNGADAAGATQGAGVAGWYEGVAGGAGGTGAGVGGTATSPNKCIGANGGAGGLGSGGAGGSPVYASIVALGAGVAIADVAKIAPQTLWTGRTLLTNIVPQRFVGGAGGGSGGGDGSGSGGGGGAGGGVCAVFAYDARTWTGAMSATGGNGGNGGGTNCGGGGGGGGGFAALVTSMGTPTAPGARTVTGGTGGSKTGTGVAGSNGSNGTAVTLLV